VLGRNDVASIIDSNGRVAIAVGGEGGLGYTRLRNKREGTTSQHYAPWKMAVAASTRVARRLNMSGEQSVFEDAQGPQTNVASSAKCDGFIPFPSRKESRGKLTSSMLSTSAIAANTEEVE
jgi:hypothetical protein